MKSRTQLSDFTFTFHLHVLEKEMATHSSVLAWRIPGMVEHGGLPSMGSHRVRHNWSDLAVTPSLQATWDVTASEKPSLLPCPPTPPRLAYVSFPWTLPSQKCVHAKSLQSCPTLYDPMDCSLPGSCIHGIPRQEYWSGLPCLPPGNLSEPGIEPAQLSCILSWCCSLRSPGSRCRIVVRSREDGECLLWKERGAY